MHIMKARDALKSAIENMECVSLARQHIREAIAHLGRAARDGEITEARRRDLVFDLEFGLSNGLEWQYSARVYRKLGSR